MTRFEFTNDVLSHEAFLSKLLRVKSRFWLKTEKGTRALLQQSVKITLQVPFVFGRKINLSSLETDRFWEPELFLDLSIFPQTGVVSSVFGFVAFVAIHMVAELSFYHDA